LSLCYCERGDGYRRSAESYRAGGARGEVARGTPGDTEITTGAISSRFESGTMAMLGDGLATTEPAVEHSGQMCEADGAAVRSAQKWSCAPRKITPRSNAKMRIR